MLDDVCPQNLALKWHAEASSAIYATPLITDLFSDGRKDIVVPAFLHNLEVGAGRFGGAGGYTVMQDTGGVLHEGCACAPAPAHVVRQLACRLPAP